MNISDPTQISTSPYGLAPSACASMRRRLPASDTRRPRRQSPVASRWTARYLYLAFWCHYQTLNIFEGEDPAPERWQLREKDIVEAFIAPDPSRPSHYFEFEVVPNNQWIDLEIDLTRQPFNNVHWNSGFEHATHIDAARHIWTAELRILVAALTQAGIHRGTEGRINFYGLDGPGTDSHRRAMSWGTLPKHLPQNSFHQPDSFGILKFAGGPRQTSPAEPGKANFDSLEPENPRFVARSSA